jgi:hypothetical protein
MDKDGKELGSTDETSAKKILKYSNFNQSVPFSATYKVQSDQFGKRMNFFERSDQQEEEYRKKVRDFMFREKME